MEWIEQVTDELVRLGCPQEHARPLVQLHAGFLLEASEYTQETAARAARKIWNEFKRKGP